MSKKTIHIPEKALNAWTTALRTGMIKGKPYKHVRGNWQTQGPTETSAGAYCTMGVLGAILANDGHRAADPTWLTEMGIGLLDKSGLHGASPYLFMLGTDVITANDNHKIKGARMAAAIEDAAAPYDPEALGKDV